MLATSMLTVMMAHTAASSVVSIVLAIYSVSEGDYLNALVYGAVAVAGIIGVCRWWKVSHRVEITGDKGTIALRARQETSNFIETPYGKAFQNTTGEAIKVKVYVQTYIEEENLDTQIQQMHNFGLQIIHLRRDMQINMV